MVLQNTANSEFKDTGRGFFTDILRHSAGSLSHWAAANSRRNLQFTIEPQTDGTFDVIKHLWSEASDIGAPDTDGVRYTEHDFDNDGIQLANCNSLDDAIETAERMFNNERNSWQSHSSNTQVIRGDEPTTSRCLWSHIEEATEAPTYRFDAELQGTTQPAA